VGFFIVPSPLLIPQESTASLSCKKHSLVPRSVFLPFACLPLSCGYGRGVFFWRSHKNGLEWFGRRCRWQKSAEGAAGGKPSLPSADKHGNKSARQLHVAMDFAIINPLGKPSGFSNRSITSPHFARKHACWPVPCGYKRAHNGSRCAADFAGPLKKHSFVLLRKYEGCFLRRKYKKERPQKLGQRQDRAGKKDAARPIKREILFHVHDKNNIIFLRSVGTA
jgi:hypothetical protein